ncbi:MAG: hypothetical protein COZ18_05965 [Flexibacter sp. CG_4_10_14_3_um_filter_32_15]|nr:MAG: hypothetical protein COZ18_05965 [Flexibacter sp. CG_4_10_14_3_um_filter_32_15]
MIQVKRKRTLSTIRQGGTSGGLLFIALGTVNTLLSVNGSPAMIYGGAITLVSVQFLRLFENRKYKLNSYRYLRTIPHWEGLDLEKKKSY